MFCGFRSETDGSNGKWRQYFIDLSFIQKHDQKRTYIRLRDYAITDPNGVNPSIIFIETNCEEQTARFLKDVYFKGNMAEGEYVVLEERRDWQKFKSGSIGELFPKFVSFQ